MNASAAPIALSLISHTNAGKTTLARTLLQRDVGEVRDAPHVTEFSEDHLLLRTPSGDELRLWDTPGLGDSVRLVRRLQLQGHALGWFLTEVWDRWRDRSFWYTQQALRHVRDQAQVVLYLVNASESPQANDGQRLENGAERDAGAEGASQPANVSATQCDNGELDRDNEVQHPPRRPETWVRRAQRRRQ